jgi:hypothetical protein
LGVGKDLDVILIPAALHWVDYRRNRERTPEVLPCKQYHSNICSDYVFTMDCTHISTIVYDYDEDEFDLIEFPRAFSRQINGDVARHQ